MSLHAATLSIRIDWPDGQRFGPGMALLLENIQEKGSISAAAKAMGMSYPRALSLIEAMNRLLKDPVVETFQGGVTRGGARLTPKGEKVLALYREISEAAFQNTTKGLQKLVDLSG